MPENKNLSPVEKIKQESKGLRGTIPDGLQDEITGAISDHDQNLMKFHGMYQQDDRDRREERAEKKLERLFSFMIRLRIPGGYLTPEQWIAAHHIAGEHSTGTIKITTRQTLQLHGILKNHIRPTIQAFSKAHLDSIATCGDINRNVACCSNPKESPVHEEVFSYADKISRMLMPKTRAYYEIWLDEEKLDERNEEDPLYQDRYLPRKFKIGIAIPPNNDIDVLTNYIGLIAIVENNELKGFNIAIGGGLSSTHGNPEHYARLATVIGFTDNEVKILKVVYEILTIQRDYGDRSDRKKARLKYTVDKHGVDFFKNEIQKRCGFALEKERDFRFTSRSDYYGWEQNHEGLWYYTVFVENGRVYNETGFTLKSALFEIAQTGKASFRFTSNQNVILSDIQDEDKNIIAEILQRHGILLHNAKTSAVRKNAMACVAFNTCPLALAEGQRYLPHLLSLIEPLLAKYQMENEKITIRMTGCPNGCARSANAEIGLIGTTYGRYNLHIGGDHVGYRLNKLYKESIDEASILNELDFLFRTFQSSRKPGETFGDFGYRFLQPEFENSMHIKI
ncbi:MAG: NADPH-dependent assimilatory sulfite reductase hemoprotein subunit [Flavisolibacter sp.]